LEKYGDASTPKASTSTCGRHLCDEKQGTKEERMRRGLDIVVLGAWLLASRPAAATELKYLWQKGAVERFRYEETVHWKGGAILTVRALFAERVSAAHADGRGSVELMLEALDASLGTQSFDLRDQVPPQERVVLIADRKGHFVVPESWQVAIRDGRPTVERGAKAGSSQTIEVVPRRLLGLLALPEGALERGRTVQVRNGRQTLRWRLATMEGTTATLYVTDSGPSGSHSSTQSPKREAVDLVVRFDAELGRLLEVRGTLIWTRSTRAISRVLMQRMSVTGSSKGVLTQQ
jgi:hypothetical protein